MAHDLPDPIAHPGPVAVDGASGAGGFFAAERTFLETPCGIGVKLRAIAAEAPGRAVAIPAEDPDHGLQGLAFPPDSGAGLSHVCIIVRPAPDGKGFPGRVVPAQCVPAGLLACRMTWMAVALTEAATWRSSISPMPSRD